MPGSRSRWPTDDESQAISRINGRGMNVLHIVAGELAEAASRGAYWLHRGLLALDVESRLFTDSKQTYGDVSVATVSCNTTGFALSMLRKQVGLSLATLYPAGKRGTFSDGLLGVDFPR